MKFKIGDIVKIKKSSWGCEWTEGFIESYKNSKLKVINIGKAEGIDLLLPHDSKDGFPIKWLKNDIVSVQYTSGAFELFKGMLSIKEDFFKM